MPRRASDCDSFEGMLEPPLGLGRFGVIIGPQKIRPLEAWPSG